MQIMQSVSLDDVATSCDSRNIKQSLQLLDQRPLIIADVRPVKFLQGIDTLP